VTPHTLNILLGLSTVGFVVVSPLYMIHLHDTKWKLLSKDNKIRHLESELRHYSSLYFSGCACKKNHAQTIELRSERDESRREVCELKSYNFEDKITPKAYAELRKWDCFKEEK
jgi:hypothetical protein